MSLAARAQRANAPSSFDIARDETNLLIADEVGFQLLAGFLKRRNGIDLPVSPKNLSLMASRMRRLLTTRGLTTYTQYSKLLESGHAEAISEFTSAMTTNTTHFFREGEHFDHLKTQLAEMIEAKRKAGDGHEFRVWCAAASTGQEPFTILITLLESGLFNLMQHRGVDLKFIGTDIDVEVLQKCVAATYRAEDAKGVPPQYLSKYFDLVRDARGQEMYKVKSQFSQMIRFARLNLIENWPFEKKFDLIFCRNVLIYFDPPTAQMVVERMARQLNPGGLLYVGHSECGAVRTRTVKTISTAVYKRLLTGE